MRATLHALGGARLIGGSLREQRRSQGSRHSTLTRASRPMEEIGVRSAPPRRPRRLKHGAGVRMVLEGGGQLHAAMVDARYRAQAWQAAG